MIPASDVLSLAIQPLAGARQFAGTLYLAMALLFGKARHFAATPLYAASLLFALPSPGASQGCLGLPPVMNRGELAIGAGYQNQRTRVGGQARLFAGGVFGIAVGARGGTLDEFAEGGYELGVLVAVPTRIEELGICMFGEYEQSSENIRNDLNLTTGDFLEYWARGGLAAHTRLAQAGPVEFRLSGGPDLIWRITELRGRRTYVEPNVHVLAIVQRETAFHLGARALLSFRHRRGFLDLGVKTRPRRGRDLLWTVQLGIPL